MSENTTGLNDNLRLGIAAAQAGRHLEARRCLATVLAQAPDNIPALFWLAYASDSPQESLRLLNRVLVLAPNNERAKAGLRWAQGRLDAAEAASNTTQCAAPTSELHFAQSRTLSASLNPIKPLPLPVNAPAEPNQEPVRQPAPLTLTPLSTIITVLIGALGIVAATLVALLFVPDDTLAAWWPAPTPVSTQVSNAEPSVTFVTASKNVEASPGAVVGRTLASAADTIPRSINFAAAPGPSPAVPAEAAESAAVELSPAPLELTAPVWPAVESKPVENLLLPHQPAHPNEKWIEVNVTTQQITAWEGTTPVFTFIGSTGLPNTPTVLGEFNIYWKLKSTTMVGPNYYLPEVPYTMYFFRGYGLHGTYWHNNFGQPMSHGCVNLETGDAKTLFEWADPVLPPGQTQVVSTADKPGTLVVVHR